MLKLGAGTAALWATGIHSVQAKEGSAKKKLPIALQLYSVRGECGKDLPGTLAAVAKMGYEGVEFAGYYGRDAKTLRKMLDDNGLKCCGTHTGLDTLTGDHLKATIEFNKILGNEFLIVPSLPGKCLASEKAIKETAKLFTELAAKAKPAGMHVGYHAHGGDFRKFGKETCWEILFGNAGPDVVMQLDTGNCLGAGGDPIAMLKKFPGRSLTVHLKEHGGKANAPVGEGTVPWKEVFKICESTGGTKWYIVEHEGQGAPLDSVKKCLQNLKKM
jgi:sugar phosphate isomerase/epimerase